MLEREVKVAQVIEAYKPNALPKQTLNAAKHHEESTVSKRCS